MATETTNYHLIKPEDTDRYTVDDFNDNFDVIDAQLKSNADHANNSTVHITSSERSKWNNHTNDTVSHITSAERTKWDGHTDDSTIHVSSTERTKWNNHDSNSTIHITDAERVAWNGMLPLSGGTLTGNLYGKYISGTWLQTTANIHLSSSPADYPVLSQGWIYSRTKAEMISDLGIDEKLSKSGGTMTGQLKAQANTAYTTGQMRNIILSTAEPTASDGSNGDVWIQYE